MSAQIPFVKFPIYPLAALIGATPKDSRETYLHFASGAGDTGGETPYLKFPETQSVVINDNFFATTAGAEYALGQRAIYRDTDAGGSFTYTVPGDVTTYANDDASAYNLGGGIYSFPSGTEVTWAVSNDLVQISEPALYFNHWPGDATSAYSVPFSGKYYYGVVYDGYNGGNEMSLATINIATGVASIVYISGANNGTGVTPFPMLFSHVLGDVSMPGSQSTSDSNYFFPFCGKELDVVIPGNLGDLSGFVLPTFEED